MSATILENSLEVSHKVAGSKSMHTDNELSEKEIKITIPFTIASKAIKYLRIHLTKEVKDLYTENCTKTLMKEIEDINK